MGDDDEVRELIGRMSAAQRQGFHVTPAAMRLVIAALRFYLAARTWLAKPHRDPHDDAPRKPPEKYTGPLPTIGDSRRLGLVACTIQCAGPNCWHETRFNWTPPRTSRFWRECDSLAIIGLEAGQCVARLGSSMSMSV